MSPNILETGLLSRIEELLNALETREKNSKEFLALCSELQTCLEMAPLEKITPEQVGDVSSDLKDRLVRTISRIKMLETFSTAQTEITSNLQKYIVATDK
jgi:hypothetical protein